MHLFSFFRRRQTLYSFSAGVIAVCAIIGMVDSFYLVLEYIQVLIHPGEPSPCTVNTLVSCTKTVQGIYGHYFPNIPNPMLGMLWYAGFVAYGVTRFLGASFPRYARMFVGIILLLGLSLSYRLYFASIFELRGVCPFCLTSTTASTLIALGFVIDDRTYNDALIGPTARRFVYGFQFLSIAFFVFYLPYFIVTGLMLMPDPMTAVTHWSMPVMASLVVVMAISHIVAYRSISRS